MTILLQPGNNQRSPMVAGISRKTILFFLMLVALLPMTAHPESRISGYLHHQQNSVRWIIADEHEVLRFPAGFVLLEFSGPIEKKWVDTLDTLGLHRLEPPGSFAQLVWCSGNRSIARQKLPGLTHFAGFPDSMKISQSILTNQEGVIPIAIWVFEPSTPMTGLNLFSPEHAETRSGGTLRVNSVNGYSIYYLDSDFSGMMNLTEYANIRWIYRRATQPIPEDELSTQEVITPPVRDEYSPGYVRYISDLQLSGLGMRIGTIDTGFDNNDNRTCHPDLRGRIAAYITYSGSPGFDYLGHGTHIGGILAGDGSSFVEDSSGFSLGTGILPRVRLVISDALIALPFPPTGGFPRIIRDMENQDVSILSNSWNDGGGTAGGYTANCAIWDAAARDIRLLEFPPGTEIVFKPGDFPKSMLAVFSAGNNGPNLHTLTTPKEAKNIITVAASGSLRNGNAHALNNDSSRGPCLDGRFAPLLAAPGDGIYSAWPGNSHLPLSGTSTACPHVTGAAGILTQYMSHHGYPKPSPALVKAMLILNTKPETESIPDPGWGWGRLDLNMNFSQFPALTTLDQDFLFTDSSQNVTYTLHTRNPEEPLDIVLTWTDPPGAPESNPALVNNLNLLLTDGQNNYSGNRFDGHFSTPSSETDSINNVERVRIQYPSATYQVTVTSENIAGDGVPFNGMNLDQDFAIAVRNADLITDIPRLAVFPIRCSIRSQIRIAVTNQSLAGTGTVTVSVSSLTAETTIILYETHDVPGLFTGTLTLDPDRTDIPVLLSDSLEIRYISEHATMTRTVLIDGILPEIIHPMITRVTARSIEISWLTGELARCHVKYRRIAEDDEWTIISESAFDTNHRILLEDLDECQGYQCMIIASDIVGNTMSSLSQYDYLYAATDTRETVYTEDFTAAPAWDLQGRWEWGIPAGTGTPPDPESGFTGPAVLGFNLAGNYDFSQDPIYAVSPVLDCGILGDYTISYYRWLGTESNLYDLATISALNNNELWDEVWRNPMHEFYDGDWSRHVIDVTLQASGNSHFQFRFSQGPTDRNVHRCGWNLDDIVLTRDRSCGIPVPTPYIPTSVHDLELTLNQQIFTGGDELTLQGHIYSRESLPHYGLALLMQIGETELFYPAWNTNPDFAVIPGNTQFQETWTFLDFNWPENITRAYDLEFWGVIFNPDSLEILDEPTRITCEFYPSVQVNP